MPLDWKNESGKHFEEIGESVLKDIYPWLLVDFKNIYGNSLHDKTILEIGCGPGFMLQQFVSTGPKLVLAGDISQGMLQKALCRISCPNCHPVLLSAESLPFISDSIDIVYSRGSIFFWPDIRASIKEIARILRPDGFALIGGGYGFSTPIAILDKILREHDKERKKSVPRIDLNELFKMAETEFNFIRIHQQKKRGFWLELRKTSARLHN
ncbi:MAG: hypothetical protein Kow0029_31870 [Candidatus Rifleibacteriota bacterium]